jgi:hypothetical protein
MSRRVKLRPAAKRDLIRLGKFLATLDQREQIGEQIGCGRN